MPRPSNVPVELLETFVAVVHYDGDAAQAARFLHINQPSMSKRLRNLREAGHGKLLQIPWLERTGKTWKLTAEGYRVLPAAKELLSQHRQFHQFYTSAASSAPEYAFRFASGQTIAQQLVVDALSQWPLDTMPIRVSTMRDEDLVHGVASGALDMALVSLDEDEVREVSRVAMHLKAFVDYGFVAVCADDADGAKQFAKLPEVVRVKALVPYRLIVPEPNAQSRAALNQAITHNKLDKIHIVVETGGWRVILEHVRYGHGVGIISEAGLPLETAKDLIIRRIHEKDLPKQHLSLLTRQDETDEKGNPTSSAAKIWVDALTLSRDKHLAALGRRS